MSTRVLHVFGGVPSYFRACCSEAAHRVYGCGYDHPAYELMRHIESHSPYSCDDGDWEAELDDLRQKIEKPDDGAVIRWFLDHFPRCMRHVPARRRSTFLNGVYRAARDFEFAHTTWLAD